MTFNEFDAKVIASAIRGAFPTDRPLSVEVSVRCFNPDTGEYLNLILAGSPPNLTVETVVNGSYVKWLGNT